MSRETHRIAVNGRVPLALQETTQAVGKAFEQAFYGLDALAQQQRRDILWQTLRIETSVVDNISAGVREFESNDLRVTIEVMAVARG